MLTSIISTALVSAAITLANAQSLTIVNKCTVPVFVFTQTNVGSNGVPEGSIDQDVTIPAGENANMNISGDWAGAINIGLNCNSEGSKCDAGGPTWDGVTPFSRAEFNYFTIPGSVTYDISNIYGYSVGMEIATADSSCDAFACTISSGCPVPGPDGSCYSPCCSSVSDCSAGALPKPAQPSGGCVNLEGPGPNSQFYYTTCPNAYAFPDNDGANGYKPANTVDYTCTNTDTTLTLCPGTTSHYPAP